MVAQGLPHPISIWLDNRVYLSAFVHKVASLSESALVLLVEDLAFARSIELAIFVCVLGPQLLNSMCESASILIRTISLLHKVLAQLDLYVASSGHGEISVGWVVLAFASFKGIALFEIGLSLMLVFDVVEREGVEGCVVWVVCLFFVFGGVVLPLIAVMMLLVFANALTHAQ